MRVRIAGCGPADLAAHAGKYQKIAGGSIAELNAGPPIIPAGARIGG